MHLAAAMASVEPLRFLLSIGFDANVVNNSLETPLFVAARMNNIDGAGVLIDNGADFRSMDVKGKWPFFLVKKTRFE